MTIIAKVRVTRVFLVCAIALGLALVSPSSLASFVQGVEAYQRGDYATARVQFEIMAKLGHRSSQYNLAMMLLNGEGGPVRPADAFAWLSVAAAAGDVRAADQLAKMQPFADSRDLERASELMSSYGPSESSIRLQRATFGLNSLGIRFSAQPEIQYPREARREDAEGWVVVEVFIGPDGGIRDPRTAFQLRGELLEFAALAGLQSGKAPGPPDPAIRTRIGYVPVQFDLTGGDSYRIVETRLAEVCERADRGDPAAQAGCGFILAFERRLRRPDKARGYAMLVRAALAGQPEAALMVASALWNVGDATAAKEAILWWEIAGQNGNMAGRMRSVDAWLGRTPLDDQVAARAAAWIDAVAASDDQWALKHVAAHLATHPSPRIRNAARALELIGRLQARRAFDPQVIEIEAAAMALQGDSAAATRLQSEAIEAASQLGWDTAGMAERRARYLGGGVWTGDLIQGAERAAAND